MPDAPTKKPTSKIIMFFYLILGIIALTLLLEMTGVADVVGTRESEQMIERPHN